MSLGLQIAIIVLLCVIMVKGMDLKDDKKENENNQPLVRLKGGVRKYSEYFNQLLASRTDTTPHKIIEVYNLKLPEPNQTLTEPDTYTGKEEKMKRQYQKSQYHGITQNQNTGKWQISNHYTKEQKEMLKNKYNTSKFGSFDNEKDAAMKVNDICEKMGIDHKNPDIGINTTEKVFKTKSKYKNVYMHHPEPRWNTQMKANGKTYYLGRFKDENDAGRAVNKKCAELRMKPKNPEHLFNQNSTHDKNVEDNKTKSRFQCVSVNREKKRWIAKIYKPKVHLGYFDTEIEAARALNEICIKFNIEQDPEFLRDELRISPENVAPQNSPNVTMTANDDETDVSMKRKRID